MKSIDGRRRVMRAPLVDDARASGLKSREIGSEKPAGATEAARVDLGGGLIVYWCNDTSEHRRRQGETGMLQRASSVKKRTNGRRAPWRARSSETEASLL